MDPFLDVQGSLRQAILDLNPTAYWPLDESATPLRDIARGWDATVTGSPTYGVQAPQPIERAITWSGSGQYATSSGSVPVMASSMSSLVIFRSTDSGATVRHILSRAAASQFSWSSGLAGSHAFQAVVHQADGTAHAIVNSAGAVNDGLWRVGVMTFDGTTLSNHVASASSFATATSTSLTGSWHKASTSGVIIAGRTANLLLFPGSCAHLAFWNDRILTASDVRSIAAMALGG